MYGKTPSLGSSTTKNSYDDHEPFAAAFGLVGEHAVLLQRAVGGWQRKHGDQQRLIRSARRTLDRRHAADGFDDCAGKRGIAYGNCDGFGERVRGNVAVASVQFLLDGANLGSADTAVALQHVVEYGGGEQWCAYAFCYGYGNAGNTTTSAGVSVTVSNSTSNAEADFQARCATAGVIRCVTFDTASTISGNAAPGMPLIASGLTTPSIDTSTFASGGGSLHFAVPAGATSANTSGSFNIDFSDDFSQQVDSLVNGDPLSLTTACGGSPCKNEIWIQWRQRFDSGMLQ